MLLDDDWDLGMPSIHLKHGVDITKLVQAFQVSNNAMHMGVMFA